VLPGEKEHITSNPKLHFLFNASDDDRKLDEELFNLSSVEPTGIFSRTEEDIFKN